MKQSVNATEYYKYHNDGSVWAKGSLLDGKEHGYWEWFRKDGTIMRSGYFNRGIQTGEWTTYDKSSKPYKSKTITPPYFIKIGVPAIRALLSQNIHSADDLSMHTKSELLSLHGIGPNTLPALELALKENGLTFKAE